MAGKSSYYNEKISVSQLLENRYRKYIVQCTYIPV
jgi:hypothetical protein